MFGGKCAHHDMRTGSTVAEEAKNVLTLLVGGFIPVENISQLGSSPKVGLKKNMFEPTN